MMSLNFGSSERNKMESTHFYLKDRAVLLYQGFLGSTEAKEPDSL